MRSGPAAAAGARAAPLPPTRRPAFGSPRASPGPGSESGTGWRSAEQEAGQVARVFTREGGFEKLGGYRAGEIRDGHGSMVGGLVFLFPPWRMAAPPAAVRGQPPVSVTCFVSVRQRLQSWRDKQDCVCLAQETVGPFVAWSRLWGPFCLGHGVCWQWIYSQHAQDPPQGLTWPWCPGYPRGPQPHCVFAGVVGEDLPCPLQGPWAEE